MLIGSGFVLLAWIVLWIAGFVDALMSDADKVRVMPKAVWVILILLFSGFAAIAWFVFGRPRVNADSVGSGGSGTGFSNLRGLGSAAARSGHPSTGRTDEAQTGWQLGGTGGKRTGPIAPDDDPEFLRQLGRRPKPGDTTPEQ